jgi:hypothetical protein
LKILFSSPAVMLATTLVSATVAYNTLPPEASNPVALSSYIGLTSMCASQASMYVIGRFFGKRMLKHYNDVKDQFDVAKQHGIDPRHVVRPQSMAGFVRNGCMAPIFMLAGFVGGAIGGHKMAHSFVTDMIREKQTITKPVQMADNGAKSAPAPKFEVL